MKNEVQFINWSLLYWRRCWRAIVNIQTAICPKTLHKILIFLDDYCRTCLTTIIIARYHSRVNKNSSIFSFIVLLSELSLCIDISSVFVNMFSNLNSNVSAINVLLSKIKVLFNLCITDPVNRMCQISQNIFPLV